MEPSFWLDRWDRQEIGFHQGDFDAALVRYWPRLDVPAGSRVFVPLCGKSLDMVWLAQQGYRVIGAELSERAVDDFFAERGLTPDVRREAGFVVKSSGPYEIWIGDIFALPVEAVQDVGGVYDRAALVALPADMQHRYAEQIETLTPKAPILLITIDYDQCEMPGPPFATSRAAIEKLFAGHYQVEVVATKDALDAHPHFKARGLTALTGSVAVLIPR
jgi:thiopurine S-methyltransferase